MAVQIPKSRPQIKRPDLIAKVTSKFPGIVLPKFFIIGVRGYYEDTMGKPGQNDRLMYDDAIFLIDDTEFISFNCNCDPGAFKKGIATLKQGIWPCYRFDIHRGRATAYPAICQRVAPVTITRDGKGEETGMFGINIHKGGINSVSSEGCQTLPPFQWDEFYSKARMMHGRSTNNNWQATVTYILIEE